MKVLGLPLLGLCSKGLLGKAKAKATTPKETPKPRAKAETTPKGRQRQRHSESKGMENTKDLLRGQAQREGLREQNRDQREHRGKAKMEGEVHENAAGKADAGGQ